MDRRVVAGVGGGRVGSFLAGSRTALGPGRRVKSARPQRVVVAVAVAALLAGACASQPAPSTTVMPSVGPATVAPATPTPTMAQAGTLRIGVDLVWYRGWLVGIDESGVPALTFGRLVYSSLYRYDGHDNAIPDLAEGPCFVPGTDAKVIRCRLIETTFQDGTPLTADDVAYTYQVFQRPVMNNCCTLTGSLKEVRVVDPRTVDFVLGSVDPTFLTGVLPMIPILSRHSIEAAVAAFDAATKGLTAKGLATLADDINAEIGADPPVCSDARVAQVDAMYRRFGFHVYHEDLLKNGQFDACGWIGNAVVNLMTGDNYGGSVGYPLGQTGIERVAGVVGILLFFRPDIFVGTGPYRYVSQDVDSVHFEAWPGYHGGMAATKYVDFARAKGDGSDLDAGAVDILPGAYLGTAYQATAGMHGVRVATLPTAGLLRARRSMSGRVTSTPTEPSGRRSSCASTCRATWRRQPVARGRRPTAPSCPAAGATTPACKVPTRDTAAARTLIEAAGWQLGADGIYAKGGVRLGAQILVKAEASDRVKMADLIASQARDCGMDLRATQVTFDEILTMLGHYPHDIPARRRPSTSTSRAGPAAPIPTWRASTRPPRSPTPSTPMALEAPRGTSAASVIPPSTASSLRARPPTTRPSGPGSTARRRRSWHRRCRRSSSGPPTATTPCAQRSRPSTGRST